MKWHYIRDKQPEHEESIIHCDRPYHGHYCLGMRNYYQNCSWQEILDMCDEIKVERPDFWWISAKDFPFPDQEEENA